MGGEQGGFCSAWGGHPTARRSGGRGPSLGNPDPVDANPPGHEPRAQPRGGTDQGQGNILQGGVARWGQGRDGPTGAPGPTPLGSHRPLRTAPGAPGAAATWTGKMTSFQQAGSARPQDPVHLWFARKPNHKETAWVPAPQRKPMWGQAGAPGGCELPALLLPELPAGNESLTIRRKQPRSNYVLDTESLRCQNCAFGYF